MDTNRLADILAYRIREHLGAQGDYAAYVLPNELAIQVRMRSPEHLRGFEFTFREGEPLPPQITGARGTVPTMPAYDAQGIPVTNPPMRYQLQTANGGVMAVATATNQIMRTREQQDRFDAYQARVNNSVAIPPGEWNEYVNLASMAPFGRFPTPLVIPTRTIEQEARYLDLQSAGTDREWTVLESAEVERLGNLAPCPTPIPARTYVRVHRDSYSNNWIVSVKVGTVNKDLPTIAVIKSLLNPADKHFLPARQGRYSSTISILKVALSAGLPAQSLVDALRAWVMATENQVTSAESVIPSGGIDSQTANLLRAQPATLEVGGIVYRLVPCHQTDVRPLIARVRAKALSHAQVEAATITTKATTDARVTVTEAERTAARLRAEAEAEARRAGRRVPDWVRDSHRSHYWNGERWLVEIKVQCMIRDIRLYIPRWASVLHWKPIVIAGKDSRYYSSHKLPLWFRINVDGAYDKHNISASWPAVTTHIACYMCMDLQGMPVKVETAGDLDKLEECISRGMQVINLNSPLDMVVANYWPDFKEQLPPVVVKWLKGEVRIDPPATVGIARFKEMNPTITWDSIEGIKEEEEGTFSTLDTPIPLRPVVEPVPTIDLETANRLQEIITRRRNA